MKLAYFNKLPPRTEYIRLVNNVLKSKQLSLFNIQKKTGLTKTQVACTLEKLIQDNVVERIKDNKKVTFRLK